MSNKKCSQTNREMIIEVKSDVRYLREGFDNHLLHHFRYSIIAYATALTAIGSLIVGLILKLF